MHRYRLSPALRTPSTLLLAAALSLLAPLAMLASPFAGSASAQDRLSTSFDFEAPAPEQEGVYQPEPSAELAAGLGQSALRAGWPARAQLVRVRVALDNMGMETSRGVVEVPLSLLPAAFRSEARFDGQDVVAFLTDGTALEQPLASGVSTPSSRGTFLVRLETLQPGASDFFLYAGDRASASPVEELAFFTDPTPLVRYFVMGSYAATNVTIASMIDANEIAYGMGMSAMIDAAMSSSFVGAELGTAVRSTGPIAGMWQGALGDAIVPESFAGTHFVIPSPRYDEDLVVASPFGNATLTFTRPAIADQMVMAGEIVTIPALVGDAEAIVVDSDVPVVIVHGSASGDITPMPPAATELFGLGSGNIRAAAGPAGATLTYYGSDGIEYSATIPANGEISLSGGVAQGAGIAVRIFSDEPIGALTYGDGDGGEAVAFLPPRLMGSEYALPLGAQFIALAVAQPNTTCRVLQADGSELASATTGALAQPISGRIFFGSTTNGLRIAAPSVLRCSGPVWALLEEASSDVEKLLISAAAHRPHPGGQLDVSAPDAAETRFEPGLRRIVTPTLRPTRAMVSLERFDVTATTPPGSSILYQLSFDGGATWMVPSGGSFVAAGPNDGATPSALLAAGFEEATSLTVRALIETDGSADPTLDQIDVEVGLVPPPTTLRIESIPSPQSVGVPFTAVILALDDLGRTVSVQGEVALATDPNDVIAPQTVAMVGGRAEVLLTPAAPGTGVRLNATFETLSTTSNAFEVRDDAGATLRLDVLSGDMQFADPGAELPEAVVVRVTDAGGFPRAGVEILFEVTAGGGSFSPGSVTTDADGQASARWTLGAERENRGRAVLAADSTVARALVARADTGDGGGGGCSVHGIHHSPTSRAPFGAALFLLALGLTIRLRRVARRRRRSN